LVVFEIGSIGSISMKIINYLNRTIEFSFYALFLLVPLIFTSATSELFEFPKMWLTFILALFIATSWALKMILEKRFYIKRTPLDIPLLIFLTSQIISTIFSLDPHVSFWGYYSRFNGGLLSIFTYILLYFAFVSNFSLQQLYKLLKIALYTGLIVAAWGFPSHFGYDPTCLIFRGSFDTSCWTDAFKPTIRMFSTLGQPAWLAAYLSILIPISIAHFLRNRAAQAVNSEENKELRIKNQGVAKNNHSLTSYFLLLTSVLFYIDLTYTNTRGGFIGFWVANLIFWGGLYFKKIFTKDLFLKYFLTFNLLFLSFNFIQGVPIGPELLNNQSAPTKETQPVASTGELGGTDSGKIRLLVWRGAVSAWNENKLIGTGVETFAYAYYKHKPKEHNLTTEWDFLYNKAHNEYLNYLATTGIFGLGSYLLVIGAFLLKTGQWLIASSKQRKKSENNHKPYAISNILVIFGLVSGYISILITNFFGFSVVIINLFFFLIPAFVYVLSGIVNTENAIIFPKSKEESIPASVSKKSLGEKIKLNKKQWALSTVLLLVSLLGLLSLIDYIRADMQYSQGSNLNKGGAYQEAFPYLINAASLKPNEPVYKDELSLNMGTLAAALILQKDASNAATFTKEAIALNDDVVRTNPNNIVFWKNRVRLFYTLAQADTENEKKYIQQAIEAITKARSLAPNDAKVTYNLGVMIGQSGDRKKAVEILEESIKLKPNYRDAYFALGLYYDELGQRQKAINTMQYILTNIDPNDEQAKETLEGWR
jgi:putative inorganic carbon (hco3(-)) transporter